MTISTIIKCFYGNTINAVNKPVKMLLESTFSSSNNSNNSVFSFYGVKYIHTSSMMDCYILATDHSVLLTLGVKP